MTELSRVTLRAAAPFLGAIQGESSGVLEERIGQLCALALVAEPDERHLNLEGVLVALFADNPKPLDRFREMRSKVNRIADTQSLPFEIVVDTLKLSPDRRTCWFNASVDANTAPVGAEQSYLRDGEAAVDGLAYWGEEKPDQTSADGPEADREVASGRTEFDASTGPDLDVDRVENEIRLKNELLEKDSVRGSTPRQGAVATSCDPEPRPVARRQALHSAVDGGAREKDKSGRVQEMFAEWLGNPTKPPYLVLFGEYGTGKTTAVAELRRRQELSRVNGDTAARPVMLFYLTEVGDIKLHTPTLDQILTDLLGRDGPDGAAIEPADVVQMVRAERALVIFDGLDEVLVHLAADAGQQFVRELWKLLPPSVFERGRLDPSVGRVIFTCRDHFFETIEVQKGYFTEGGRAGVKHHDYVALNLLPWEEREWLDYLRRCHDQSDDDVEATLERIAGIHNLTELIARPVLFDMIVSLLDDLAEPGVDGIRAAGVYETVTKLWLVRDQTKHRIDPDIKLRLMEDLATELWREGRRSIPAADLKDWLRRRLRGNDEVGYWYDPQMHQQQQLEEDLRTATFIVRPGSDSFEFAHASMQEYFLARALKRALIAGDLALWAIPNPSRETLDFLVEMVRGSGQGERQGCVEGLRRLRDAYLEDASELAFRFCARAADSGPLVIALDGFDLRGAKLRGLELNHSGDAPLRLGRCDLSGADLRDARFRGLWVDGGSMDRARLTLAEFHDCRIDRLTLSGADLSGTVFRGVRASGVDLTNAHGYRTQWLRADLSDHTWPAERGGHIGDYSVIGDLGGPPSRGDAKKQVFDGHTDSVNALAYSPDSRRLATASYDNTTRIWDPTTAEHLLTLRGHTRPVYALAYSPDSRHLATGSRDNTTRIWDPTTAEHLLTLSGHTGSVFALAYSPDSRHLATGSDDHTARIWDPITGEYHLTLAAGKVSTLEAGKVSSRVALRGRRLWRIRGSAVSREARAERPALPGGTLRWAGGRVEIGPEMWRDLGWLAPSPQTGRLTRYPAEVFGPIAGIGGNEEMS